MTFTFFFGFVLYLVYVDTRSFLFCSLDSFRFFLLCQNRKRKMEFGTQGKKRLESEKEEWMRKETETLKLSSSTDFQSPSVPSLDLDFGTTLMSRRVEILH